VYYIAEESGSDQEGNHSDDEYSFKVSKDFKEKEVHAIMETEQDRISF
jgi:hypothetical protein